MSNIYLNNSYWEKLKFSKFRFLSLKNSSPGQFLVSSNSRNYHRILRLLVPTNKSEVLGRTCLGFFLLFCFWDILFLTKMCPFSYRKRNYWIKPRIEKENLNVFTWFFTMFTLSCIYSDSSNNTIKFWCLYELRSHHKIYTDKS